MQPAILDRHVAALANGLHGRGVGGWAADAVLLERLDQRRLRVARRGLREVLLRRERLQVERLALRQIRQDGESLVLLVVAALDIDRLVAVEDALRRPGVQGVAAGGNVHADLVEARRRHLARQSPLPDELIQAELVWLQLIADGVRAPCEARRADRLVRFLRTPGLRAVGVRPLGHERLAEAPIDHLAGLCHRARRDRDRVGAHVGDQADLAFRQRDALVQRLCGAHRTTRSG